MVGYLILLFTIIPMAELALLIKIGRNIGVANTLLIVIFTGILGAYLARAQGLSILKKMRDEISQGLMPTENIFDGVIILCGGILLLTPGLITDAIGFVALVPFTRGLIKRWLRRRIENAISSGKIVTRYSDQDHIDI